MNTKPPCANKPELWDATNPYEADQARNICRTACKVLDACQRMRANEMQPDFTGTWAGDTIGEDKIAAVAACGTDSGYYRHLRQLKDTPCADCRAAHSVAEVARLKRKEANDAA